MNDKHIKLSVPLLAGIYSGKITNWNDPAIQAVNPGIDLPDHVIIPVHRLDQSGDTFIFTQYLSDFDLVMGADGEVWHRRVMALG